MFDLLKILCPGVLFPGRFLSCSLKTDLDTVSGFLQDAHAVNTVLTSLELLSCSDAAKKPWLRVWRLGGFALIASSRFSQIKSILLQNPESFRVYGCLCSWGCFSFFPDAGIWNTPGIQSVSFVQSMLFFRHLPRGWCLEFPCKGKSSPPKKLPNTSKSLLELSAVCLYLGHNVCTLVTLWELLLENGFFLECCTDNKNWAVQAGVADTNSSFWVSEDYRCISRSA